jgi:hypothetical protein
MSRVICMDQELIPDWMDEVCIERLFWDWNDPSAIVKEEIRKLGGRIANGCWFLNPMVKIYAYKPTRSYFKAVRWHQSAWFRVLTRQFGSANWRKKMLATKDRLERLLEFSGYLEIDGEIIDPHAQWLRESELGLHPESDFVWSSRPQAYPCLKSGDWDSLREMSRSELELQLSGNPNDPLYVSPGITLIGFQSTPVFYSEAEKQSSIWHGMLHRVFGNRKKSELARTADWKDRLLIFHGTLVINGMIYLPGCWPVHFPSKFKLKRTPFGTTTVPAEYLGLKHGSS